MRRQLRLIHCMFSESKITDYSETETVANKPKEQIFVAGANVTFQLMATNKIADFFSEA